MAMLKTVNEVRRLFLVTFFQIIRQYFIDAHPMSCSGYT